MREYGLSGSYGIGRLAKVVDGSGTTLFEYDHRGNLTAKQQTIGTTSAAQLAYEYDLADRITQITYPSGRLVQYGYDSKGRVNLVQTKASAGVGSWTVIASGHTYEPFGPVASMTLGNGLAVANGWDSAGLLASRRLYRTSDGSDLSHLTYIHDADGNIGSVTDHLDAANSVAYGYDKVGRLTLAVMDGSGGTGTQSYSYTSGTNRLAAMTDAAGTRTIAYDARGNTFSETRPGGVTAAAEYDGYGRLTGYDRTGVGSSDFVYNGLDDRVTMALDTAGIRRFVYDADGRVMGEYGTSASDVKAEFIWALPQVGAAGPFGGDDGLGGYMPLAVATPDTTGMIQLNWVHGNHLGVPLVVTGAGGGLPITPNDYLAPGFPGQSRVFADLYYNRYRDYDPVTGRYIQADPIGLEGGSNPYLYAGANPVNAIDPLGLDALYIDYKGYPIGIGGYPVPTGHAGVAAIDPRTGRAVYYEFGLYEGARCGRVRRRIYPGRIRYENGNPNQDDLWRFAWWASRRFGKGYNPYLRFTRKEISDVTEYAERRMRQVRECERAYKFLYDNCYTFAREAADP